MNAYKTSCSLLDTCLCVVFLNGDSETLCNLFPRDRDAAKITSLMSECNAMIRRVPEFNSKPFSQYFS